YTYDAWGKCDIVSDTSGCAIASVNPFRYRGYYYDTETKLYYLNARYFDSEIGRFISADDISYLEPETIGGVNLYAYCGNNPVSITYSSFNASASGGVISTIERTKTFGEFSGYWVNLQPLPSWVNTAINVADIGFSLSLVGRTAWYTLRYPGVAALMELDGITVIPGKYTDFVNWLGYGFIALETGLDIYANIQQGQSAGYVLGSAVYVAGTGLGIVWASAKIGSYVGTVLGVPIAGFIVGIAVGAVFDWLAGEIKEWIF
ncbi:MAG: RHS repeat-associated core domain-containing protein, partial [Clostridia bacterium]|nr:RHS repeat-associated core domain-containing protein [Clostridia bacterium]